MPPDYQTSRLFQRLRDLTPSLSAPATLLNELSTFFENVREEMKYVVVTFPEFTPHDEEHHLTPLLRLADRLLGPTFDRLGGAEVCVLVTAVLTHDWGMAVSDTQRSMVVREDGARSSDDLLEWERDGWRRFLEDSDLPEESDTRWRAYIRTTHAARSGQRLRKELAHLDPVFANAVALVAEGHSLDLREITDTGRYPTQYALFGEPVNVGALAIYMRMIDLLDIAGDRTPLALWKFVAPRDPVSSAEWAKHRAISPVAWTTDEPRQVVIDARTTSPAVYSRLEDLKAYVLEQTGANMRALAAMEERYRTNVSDIVSFRIEAEGFLPRQIRIEPDRRAVLQMLARTVYADDRLAFVRELLQNSVDALDARASLHEGRGSGSQFPDGAIDVTLVQIGPTEANVVWRDNGIGMSLPLVEGFLARAGVSWYNSKEFARLDRHRGATSQFGIGFLSCFGATDEPVTVRTRIDTLLGQSPLLTIVIPDVYSHFQIHEAVAPEFVGTEIEVRCHTDPATLIDRLRELAGFVQYPIRIHQLGNTATVRSAVDTGSDGERPDFVSFNAVNTYQALTPDPEQTPPLLSIRVVVDTPEIQGVYQGFAPKNPLEWTATNDLWESAEGRIQRRLIPRLRGENGLYLKGVLAASARFGGRGTQWFPAVTALNFPVPVGLRPTLDRKHLDARLTDPRILRFFEAVSDEYLAQMGPDTLSTPIGRALTPLFAEYFLGIPSEACMPRASAVPILEPGVGLEWVDFNAAETDEFWEAPYELRYIGNQMIASELQRPSDILRSWSGPRAHILPAGFTPFPYPWLDCLSERVRRPLRQHGFQATGLRFVEGGRGEPLPLVMFQWTKSSGVTRLSFLPPLLPFPSGFEEFGALGTVTWNSLNLKMATAHEVLSRLERDYSALDLESKRISQELISGGFAEHTVEARSTTSRLAIRRFNLLLEVAERAGLGGSVRLADEDFYPGSVSQYENPYHYDWKRWRGSRAGSPL